MWQHELTGAVVGLSCGLGQVLYLLLVLHTAYPMRGIWRNVLLFSWPLHVAWPSLVIMFVVGPWLVHPERDHDPAAFLFLGLWMLPIFTFIVGALRWQRAHPHELKLDRTKRSK